MSRMITRQEAALLLDMTPQNISNWIEKGLIKGHYINHKQVMVDRNSIETHFDKLSDLAFMEKRIDAMKAELTQVESSLQMKLKDMTKSDELFDKSRPSRVINASLQALYRVAGEELLSCREKSILEELFEGKSIPDVANDFYMSCSGVSTLCARAISKIKELQKYPSLHRECQELKAENKTLRLYVETLDRILATFQGKSNLEDPVSEPEEKEKAEMDRLKELLSTNIRDLDINIRTLNSLKGLGAETLGDVVRLKRVDLLKMRNFGTKSFTLLENYLQSHGLSLEMDVDTIIAGDIRKWRLQKERQPL